MSSEKQLYADIRAFCLECNGGSRNGRRECSASGCKLYQHRLGMAQINLFDTNLRPIWITDAYKILADSSAGTTAWADDIREWITAAIKSPGHRSWWGALFRGLKHYGWIRTTEMRRSKYKSANGRYVHMWVKKG